MEGRKMGTNILIEEFGEVFTPEEVAEHFKLPLDGVLKLIREGEIPAIKIGEYYRIPFSVFEKYYDKIRHHRGYLTPEDCGFGMWKDREDIGDSVEYVNKLRSKDTKEPIEFFKELEEWEKEEEEAI
jgi:excisionase family DNA binding protein